MSTPYTRWSDLTEKQVLALADSHIRRFDNLLGRANAGAHGVRADECRMYLSLWHSIREKRGLGLTQDQRYEVQDALDSGDYDSLLEASR